MNLKHGKRNDPIYNIWRSMISRCHNENLPAYENYGGRGISVCKRWQDFTNFYADMGDAPEGLTLDRIDNSKGYSPDNCRWAEWSVQARNKRGLKPLTANGKTQLLTDWAEETGIAVATLWARRAKGWDDERVVNTPIRISIR